MNSENRKMRLCLLTSTFHPFVGGGETHALLLGRALIKQGSNVVVITRRHDKSIPRKELIEGIPVYRVPPAGCKRIGKYLMLWPVLWKLIGLRKEYDLILVSGLRLLSFPALFISRILRKKCVLRAASCGELSGAFIWESPHLQGGKKTASIFKLIISIRNSFFLKADGFLAISKAVEQEYLDCGVPRSKIDTVNNGTDTDKYQAVSADEKAQLREKLGFPNCHIFSYSGKLNKGKGLDFLLELWKDFNSRNPKTHLILIGSGHNHFLSCEKELRTFVSINSLEESVSFTGFRQNVDEYLKLSDFFVFPSQNESLSNSLIEALSCGLPCLASNVGGIPDSVIDNFNGFLLPPTDKQEWIRAMETLLSDAKLAAKFSINARERILIRNSIESVAERYLDFMNTIRES
jgi:glycosyltransferase involved in cell wall biosynthesis